MKKVENDQIKTPIDGEFGVDYQIYVLRQMVNQLPKDVSILINNQIDQLVKALGHKQSLLIKSLIGKLEDVMVDVNYLEFDRQATAKERDAAIKKYNDKFE